MANLIYTALMSLDSYISDKNGKFDWAAPDEEVHSFIIGDGNRALPSDIRLKLTLQDERRFRNGMVYLQYRASTSLGT
jgi:hypothetical protein